MNQTKEILLFGAAMFTAAVGWVAGAVATIEIADAIKARHKKTMQTMKQPKTEKKPAKAPLHAVK